MVRSATALFAVLILSGFAAIQQVATHTVVRGDTLWDLAQRYYQNPFDWRRIWEANRDQVADPNLILPGWVLDIPGREAAVTEVVVEEAAPDQPMAQPVQPPARAPDPNAPTIFAQDTATMRAGVVRTGMAAYHAVPRVQVWSAPWVVPAGREPDALGRIEDFAGGASLSRTARAYDRVRLTFTGEVPRVGTQLLAFRREKTIATVGEVMQPTGVVTVSEIDGATAIGVVGQEFARVTLGDLLRVMPEYRLVEGQYSQAVSGGGEAMVMGFAGQNVLQDVGGIAFLDQGSDDGVNIGDEYEYLNPDAGANVVEGRLQVVGVTPGMASARIVAMDDVVFRQGIVVRLARKMR